MRILGIKQFKGVFILTKEKKAELMAEAKWVSVSLEILGQTSIQRVEQMVNKELPNINDKCRGWEDWERYALGFLDTWERKFLLDAFLIANVINRREYYGQHFYKLCQEAS